MNIRFLATIVLTGILIPSVSAGIDGKCIEGDCQNGKGTWELPNGSKYVGQWKNGEYHGLGKLTFRDGSIYEGQWKENKMNGHGTYTSPDGTKREGEWENGELLEK